MIGGFFGGRVSPHDLREEPYEMARAMPKQQAQAPRRSQGMGGFFGRVGNVARQLFTPENMQVIGHTLQEIGGQPGRLDDLYARRSSQQRQDFEMGRETRQLKEHEDQRRMLEEVIAGLTPEQQMLARLSPEAFVANLLRDQSEQWSDPYAFEGGMAQRGPDNEVRVLTRPRVGRPDAGDYPDDGYDYEN